MSIEAGAESRSRICARVVMRGDEVAGCGVVWDFGDFVLRGTDDLAGRPVARPTPAPTLIQVKGVLQNRFGHEWAVFLREVIEGEGYDT